MAYVPPYPDYDVPVSEQPHTIVVHALSQNQRPVGFAPWPKQTKSKKPKRSKKL